MNHGPIGIGSRLELFVDDFLIDRLHGAERRLNHPVPQEISIVFDRPWEGNMSGGMSVLRADDGLYRLYYKAGPDQHSYGCYAESDDGITWTRPSVGLFEVAGTRDNNVILPPEIGDNCAGDFSPFEDTRPGVPADQRYKGISGMTGRVSAFASPDGIHWRKLVDEPVVEGYDAQHMAFWDAPRGEYRAYLRHRRIAAYQAGLLELGNPSIETDDETGLTADGLDNGRDIITSTSKEFVHWSKAEFITYSPGRVNELYENSIQPYHRAPHLILGFPLRYIDRGWSAATKALPELEHRRWRAAHHCDREGTAMTDAMLMCSRDGRHFSMWPESFIRPGLRKKDNWMYWDNFVLIGMLETASPIDGAPDELSMYLTEAFMRSGPPSQLRRYTLRVDGFVSVNAPLYGGEMLTRPLVFEGSELVMNYSTSAAGSVQVEVQDAQGIPLPGFALDDSEVMYGDSLEQPMLWKNNPDLGKWAGTPVRLRFVLKDADLFSLRFR
jgi:hypothetical protein